MSLQGTVCNYFLILSFGAGERCFGYTCADMLKGVVACVLKQ